MLSGYLRPEQEEHFIVAFNSAERQDLVKPYVDPLVITALISSFQTRRAMVDTSSLVDVLFWYAF